MNDGPKDFMLKQLDDKFLKMSDLKSFYKNYGDGLLATEKETIKNKITSLRKIYRSKKINAVNIYGGTLSIGPRPGIGKLQELYKDGTDIIVTLLKKKENADDINNFTTDVDMDWAWFPLSASELSKDGDTINSLLVIYARLLGELKMGKSIHIHCAAGVHRTGLFTNGLLMFSGFDGSEARQLIYKMRPVTAIEKVEKHWAWSTSIVQEYLSNLPNEKGSKLAGRPASDQATPPTD